LNRGEVQKSVGFDKTIGQFESDDPKGMGRSVIIIEIGIGVEEGIFHYLVVVISDGDSKKEISICCHQSPSLFALYRFRYFNTASFFGGREMGF
jgi:hypothetical protein